MLPLYIETWIWWTFIILVTISRVISRAFILGSIKRFQSDDYIMLASIATYTALIVTINIVANADTNLLPPGFDANTLTPAEIKHREYGSKLTVVVEQCQILTIWAIKACMLIMYSRLTVKRKENVAIKVLGGYVAFTFVLMEILYLGVWCRPFHDYWAVPTPNIQCSAATNHLITNAVFNISSDTLILCVALPMFVKTRLPLRKKIAIVGIFSLGSFVILCAILNKYYSFSQPFGSEWTSWYVRESSTAILTANVPYMWALIRRVFHFRSLDSTSGNRGYTQSQTNTTRTRTQSRMPKTATSQEIDMNLLMADTESQKEGIHREIEIRVTEGDCEPGMHGGRDGISVSSDSTWNGTYGIHKNTGTTHVIELGSDNNFHSSNNVATPQPMQKAVLRDHWTE